MKRLKSSDTAFSAAAFFERIDCEATVYLQQSAAVELGLAAYTIARFSDVNSTLYTTSQSTDVCSLSTECYAPSRAHSAELTLVYTQERCYGDIIGIRWGLVLTLVTGLDQYEMQAVIDAYCAASGHWFSTKSLQLSAAVSDVASVFGFDPAAGSQRRHALCPVAWFEYIDKESEQTPTLGAISTLFRCASQTVPPVRVLSSYAGEHLVDSGDVTCRTVRTRYDELSYGKARVRASNDGGTL